MDEQWVDVPIQGNRKELATKVKKSERCKDKIPKKGISFTVAG